MTKNINNPYYKPLLPKSSWDLIKSQIFEPNRVRKYSDTLTKKEGLVIFLKAYFFISLIVTVLWLVGLMVIAFFDIPSLFFRNYEEDFLQRWREHDYIINRFIFLLFNNWTGFIFGWTSGFVGGLSLGLFRGLGLGMALALAFGLAYGLAGGLRFGLAYGLVRGLALGIAIGLTIGIMVNVKIGLILGISGGLAIGIFGGLTISVAYGLNVGVIVGLLMTLTFIISYPRLYFLPFHFMKVYNADFYKNPYVSDAIIFFPIWFLEKKLEKLAHQQIHQAFVFCQFLLEHRPLQRDFAYRLYHNVIIGLWHENPLNVNTFLPFQIIDRENKYYPNQDWLSLWEKLQLQLADSQQQSNPRLKLNSFRVFKDLLVEFKNINLAASTKWNHIYFEVIHKWLKEADERLVLLEIEAADIVSNPYQTGDPLEPERHQAIFKGREDLRDKLLLKLRNAEQMPLFLIQGQRRVGKTSLLKFLKELLGEGYKIVRLDLQGASDCRDVPTWMEAIRREFNLTLRLQEAETWKASDDWLASWADLSQYLEAKTQEQHYKVIIAMDEYEGLHEKGLKAFPEKGGHLLGAMRSFSQHQHQVVFLFAGVKLFTELEQPRWSDYFVQVQKLPVGYLKEKDSLSLITAPYENFPIQYLAEVPQHIYYLTQGHPALVQTICYKLVERFNTMTKKSLNMADLNSVLTQEILLEDNPVLANFWSQFCEQESVKETVRAIIQEQAIEDKQALRLLYRHEFIVKDERGQFKMRVPLFEQWVRKFDLDIFG